LTFFPAHPQGALNGKLCGKSLIIRKKNETFFVFCCALFKAKPQDRGCNTSFYVKSHSEAAP